MRRRFAADATTLRISATLLSTPLSRSNFAWVISAMTWASVVLPVPGGPDRITEGNRSASMARRKSFPGPRMCSCPTNFSSVRESETGKLEGTANRGADRRVGARARRHALQIVYPGDRQPDRSALGEFQRDGLLDVLRDRARVRANAERAGRELDAGTTAALHRAGSVPRRALHRRISFAPPLSGRLARRQRSAWTRRRPDAQPRRDERAAFRARDDRRLAALPLSGREPRVTRTARANGSARFEPAVESDSEKPGRIDRTETAERRHYRDHFARSRRALFHFARRPRAPRLRRFTSFHARLFSAQLRKGRHRFDPLDLSRSLPN